MRMRSCLGSTRSPESNVVDTEEVLAPRGRHVGDQRDDDSAVHDQVVDSGSHLCMIECHHNNSVEPVLQIPQVLRQHERRKYVDSLHDRAGPPFGQPLRDALHLLVQHRDKTIGARGQNEGKPPSAGAHPRTAVQHRVHRG